MNRHGVTAEQVWQEQEPVVEMRHLHGGVRQVAMYVEMSKPTQRHVDACVEALDLWDFDDAMGAAWFQVNAEMRSIGDFSAMEMWPMDPIMGYLQQHHLLRAAECRTFLSPAQLKEIKQSGDAIHYWPVP